jgi:hypothetical protein
MCESVLTHTIPGPPPGTGVALVVAAALERFAGAGLAAGLAAFFGFAFFGVGFSLGVAVGDSAGEGDAAFSAGEGDAAGDSPGVGD